MKTDPKHMLPVLVPALFFLCMFGLTLQQQTTIWFPLDDAYITIGNVELFLSGRSDLFGNAAPTGATSLVHFLALSALSQIVDTPAASLTLALTSAALYSAGLWMLLNAVSCSRVVAAAGTIAGITLGYSWFHFLNGLETGMAMAAIVWAFFFRHTGRAGALAALAGAMPFIRPEFYVLSALFFLSCVIRKPFEVRPILTFILVSFAVYAALAGISILTLGGLFPDTAGAKEAFFADKGSSIVNRVQFALSTVWQNSLILVFAGLAFAPLLRGGWVAPVFLGVVVLSAALKLPGALNHNNFRYLYPFLPIAIAAWAALLANRKHADLTFVIATCYSVFVFSTLYWPNYAGHWKTVDDKRQLATAWIADNLPNNSTIGIHDAGFMPWSLADPSATAKFRFVDLVGLKSPDAISVHEKFTEPSNGLERWRALDEIGKAQGIQYLVILDDYFWGNIQAEFERAEWQLDLIFPNPGSYQVFRANRP